MSRRVIVVVWLLTVALGAGGCRRHGVDPELDAGISPADDAGRCEPTCTPGTCGDDGCGGTCGCAADARCVASTCVSRDLMRERVVEVDTDGDGEATVTVEVAGDRTFMIVATTATDATLAVLEVVDPSGTPVLDWQDWYEASEGLTNAFFATDTTTVLNWPVRDVDPPLVDGTYVVRLGSYEADGLTSRAGVPLEVTTILTRDDDVTRGALRVAVLYAAGLDQEAHVVDSTERAVAHWRNVWAPLGIELSVRYLGTTIDPALPYPEGPGGATLLQASSLVTDGEVVVLVGETIDDSPGTYGIAGQLPGPVIPSRMSAVVVSWLTCAGADGLFSPSDIRLYGEVLAHEVGHYLGLFHPVSDTYDDWDALDDTEACTSEARCESVLGTNLMFPYSICDGESCVSTTEVTDDQRGVLKRYAGTL